MTTPAESSVVLDRDSFMRQLISSLGHLNEGILGSEIAGGYIVNVGLSMGAAIEAEYKRVLGVDGAFSLDQYAHVIVDLKQKIQGNFRLLRATEDYVEVETDSCPFGDLVQHSPSLCFMTSSVFGGIAARNFGYAKVVLHKRIALGDSGCHVTVHLRQTEAAKASIGREYFPDADRASPDIAEQLQLMERMSRLKQRLERTTLQWEALVDASPGAILVVDLDGRIAFANSGWRELAGIEGGELTGQLLTDVAVREARSSLDEALTLIRDGHRVLGNEVVLAHRIGANRTASVSGSRLHGENGEAYGALFLFQDITDRVALDRMREEFLHASSHELSTPLTTISGMTQFLLRALEAEQISPADLADRLRHIQREADRLILLGNDLSDAISMRSSGRMRLERQDADLIELARDAIHEERLHSQSVRATLAAPDAPMVVFVDRRRIAQILDNLIANAQKYTTSGSDVRVSVRSADDYAEVEIKDEGIGIPPEDLERIFDPFVRASNASSLNFPGTGLGLYIARSIAEAHGGSISVESRLGQGSTFTLRLPMGQG